MHEAETDDIYPAGGRADAVLKEDETKVIVGEDVKRNWLMTAGAATPLVIFAAWLYPDIDEVGRVFLAILGFIAWLVFLTQWPAVNLQLVLDHRDNVCVMKKRFYCLPYRWKRLAMNRAELVLGRVAMHERHDTYESAHGLGCLLGHCWGPREH